MGGGGYGTSHGKRGDRVVGSPVKQAGTHGGFSSHFEGLFGKNFSKDVLKINLGSGLLTFKKIFFEKFSTLGNAKNKIPPHC